MSIFWYSSLLNSIASYVEQGAMCKLYFAVLAHNLLLDLKDTRIGDSQNVLHNQGLEMVTDKRRGRVKLTGNFSKVKVEFGSVTALHNSKIQFHFQK